MVAVVTVKIENLPSPVDFAACELGLRIGDACLVPTERGVEMATVVDARHSEETPGEQTLTRVLRKATERDLYLHEKKKDKEEAAYRLCRKRIKARKLQMKLSRVEYIFDGSRVVFYFTANRRVDFRELVKDLARELRSRIEMRQIGARDEARLIGGMGCCSLGENCSSSFLKQMRSVSVKTAKALDLAMNPNRLSGMCGRLKCCLNFELERGCGACCSEDEEDAHPSDLVNLERQQVDGEF